MKKERLAIRQRYANEAGESCHISLSRYGEWLEHRLIYQQQLNKDLLEELQLKLISLSVASQEFDNEEDHEAVMSTLHTLMNWVKTKKFINETKKH